MAARLRRLEMKLARGGSSMSPTLSTFPYHLRVATLKAVAAAILLCVHSGGNANATMVDSTKTPPVSVESSAAGAAVAPAGWTEVNMLLDDNTKSKTVMIRDGADASEVNKVIVTADIF